MVALLMFALDSAASEDDRVAKGKAFLEKGLAYEHGKNVPQSYSEAARWYLKAAAQGNNGGQYGIALLMAVGKGVPKHAIRAYKWALLAASGGNEQASQLVKQLESHLTFEQAAGAQENAFVCWETKMKQCD